MEAPPVARPSKPSPTTSIPDKDFAEPLGELFGKNVFGPSPMKRRLPKNVYKSVLATIEKGAPLDPSIADSVASAMRDWALENGASHYAHVFYPLTGLTAEKHDSFLEPDGERQLAGRVHRQDPDPGRAGRLELPQRRHPQHLRGPRLHRLGRHQPGVHPGEPEREHALHPDDLHLLDRRGAGQEDAAAAVPAGDERRRPRGC